MNVLYFAVPSSWIMCMCAVTGVDETVIVTLKFSKNRMAVFTCSAALQLPNDAIIVGTKGTIKVGHHGGSARCCTWLPQCCKTLLHIKVKIFHCTNMPQCKLILLPFFFLSSDSWTHVVPHILSGERQGDAVPIARTLFASQLLQQHRAALPGRGGSTVFAQRYCKF